jgi:hypothetical protein
MHPPRLPIQRPFKAGRQDPRKEWIPASATMTGLLPVIANHPKGGEGIPKAPVETAPLAGERLSPFRLLAETQLRRISPWSVLYGVSTGFYRTTLPVIVLTNLHPCAILPA